MAYFHSNASGKVRASVCRDGVRASKTFPTAEAAEAWATAQEARILARRDASKALKSDAFGSIMPRRVLHARSKLPIPESELLATAVPAATMSGVYFLILRGEVVYVGQSVDVFGRLSRHLKTGRIPFDCFNIVPAEVDALDDLEAQYIAALVPRHNKSLGEKFTFDAEVPANTGHATNAEEARAHGGKPWWLRIKS